MTWTKHTGSGCPVPEDRKNDFVDAKVRGNSTFTTRRAYQWYWMEDEGKTGQITHWRYSEDQPNA